jgi:magnesium-transporting ATPase (P-type)
MSLQLQTMISHVFLFCFVPAVNTFAVNYRGRPFMQALPENKLLYRSLQACYAVLLTCALEIFPPLNDLFQLTALPDVNDVEEVESTHLLFPLIRTIGFQVFLPLVMVVDTVLAFAAEHAMRR